MKMNIPNCIACFLLIAAFAAFALPGSADTLNPATITTSLTQCETQIGGPCIGDPTASYSGILSGFSTETVGAGASLSASGFSSPTLTASVPLSTANAIDDGELEYLFEVVGAAGPVSLGVNSVGSISVSTVANSTVPPGNDANLFTLIQFQIESDSSGTAVLNDKASITYSASTNDNGTCTTSNGSTQTGVATVSASVACGASSASGGFDDTGTYTIQANAVYLVIMQADLSIGTDNGSGLSAPGQNGTVQGLATVDPILTVPSGYSLILSPGVGNSAASAVPEPASWTMLAAGIGLLMVAKRRRVSRATRGDAPVR